MIFLRNLVISVIGGFLTLTFSLYPIKKRILKEIIKEYYLDQRAGLSDAKEYTRQLLKEAGVEDQDSAVDPYLKRELLALHLIEKAPQRAKRASLRINNFTGIDDPNYLAQAAMLLANFLQIAENKDFVFSYPSVFPNWEKSLNDYSKIWPKKPPKEFLDLIQVVTPFMRNYNLNAVKPQDSYIIPPIIHQIWVGPKSRERFEKLRASWMLKHPGWLYMLWTDEELKKLKLINQAYYDRARNYGEKADILRYEVVYLFGGVYADVDTECLMPFDLLHRCYEFYAGLCNAGSFNNALIGSVAGHPILKHVIETIKDDVNQPSIPARTGPVHFTKCFSAIAPYCSGPIMPFTPSYFYPPIKVLMHQNSASHIDALAEKESFMVHGWAATWW